MLINNKATSKAYHAENARRAKEKTEEHMIGTTKVYWAVKEILNYLVSQRVIPRRISLEILKWQSLPDFLRANKGVPTKQLQENLIKFIIKNI